MRKHESQYIVRHLCSLFFLISIKEWWLSQAIICVEVLPSATKTCARTHTHKDESSCIFSMVAKNVSRHVYQKLAWLNNAPSQVFEYCFSPCCQGQALVLPIRRIEWQTVYPVQGECSSTASWWVQLFSHWLCLACHLRQGWKELKNLEGWSLAFQCFHSLMLFICEVVSTGSLYLLWMQRTGLRALYAECNAFDRISGLSLCRNLRSLFLQARTDGISNLPGWVLSVTQFPGLDILNAPMLFGLRWPFSRCKYGSLSKMTFSLHLRISAQAEWQENCIKRHHA